MEPETSPLHIYLASVPGDMDGERAVIEGMVLPELRVLAAKVGTEIALVDPAKETDAPWDLARRFREIEGCRPFFLALIGERYGDPPSAVPLDLVAAQPWLVEDPGRSVLELEILHGVLRDPGRAAAGSFFYFRDPGFPSSVPETGWFLAESQQAAERLSRLKDRIRASGRPVFDGYPCEWSEELERVSRLDALAERILDDLWRAIQAQVRRTSPRSSDPDATLLAIPGAPRPPKPDTDGMVVNLPPLHVTPLPRPPLPPEVAAAARAQGLPPLPPGYGPAPASSRSRSRWGPVAAIIALAFFGLLVFMMRRSSSSPEPVPWPAASPPAAQPPATPPSSPPPSPEGDLTDPDRVPVISVDIWPLMTRVCGLNETAERELPGRAQGGAPIVQVYSSINEEEALSVLSKLQDSGAFLLPIEEDGTTFCTVAFGPFPTLDAAREYAGGLRASGIAPEAELAYFPFFSR